MPFIQRVAAAAAILELTGLPSTPSGKVHLTQEAGKLLVDAIKQQPSDAPYVLNCIQAISTMDNARPVLVASGMVAALQGFATNPTSDKGFVAALIIALLAATDNVIATPSSTPGAIKPLVESKPTPENVISQIINGVKSFCVAPRTNQETMRGYSVDCKTILIALRSLATNEANIKALKDANIAQIMYELLSNRFSKKIGRLLNKVLKESWI
jgi:hypothetical protein